MKHPTVPSSSPATTKPATVARDPRVVPQWKLEFFRTRNQTQARGADHAVGRPLRAPGA